MSYASRKGYQAEHLVEQHLIGHVPNCYRPRAGGPRDIGDIGGIPLVVSVKNHARLQLGQWVDDLAAMVANAGVETGVVWHKRAGKGSPRSWYVTTSGEFFDPLLRAYLSLRRVS